MTHNNDLNSLLSKLKEYEKTKDYSNINNQFDDNLNSKIIDIIKKWIQSDILSNDEKNLFDLYSNIQLSFIEYCLFNSDTTENIQMKIDMIPRCLFQKTLIEILAKAIEFIRQRQSNDINENDIILIYIIRMIDARSLSYRICRKNDISTAAILNAEIDECINDRQFKNYLRDIVPSDENKPKLSLDKIYNNYHNFFIGCCTFAFALYENNKGKLKENKYVYLLAKYIRIILTKYNFEKNQSIIYCIRGIFALLTNCILTDYWLDIINNALNNDNDDNAQEKNPFNLDLFSLIINKLLASNILQEKTNESNSNNETLLIDTALVFLNNWIDTQENFDDDDEENNDNKQNQLLRRLRSDEIFKNTTRIIIPYIDAKYDRLRLMALSILSYLMNNQDFQQLRNHKSNMAKDLVKLIFNFIHKAKNQPNEKYKGISFNRLLCYLFRFLIQDFIKEETLPYISEIVNYAKNHNKDALKILRKISTNPDIKDDLLKNIDLQQFLNTDADSIYGNNSKMYKLITDIRQNLAPISKQELQTPADTDKLQAFISYSHRDKVQCNTFLQRLKQTNIFEKIWIDKDDIEGDMIDTITKGIKQSIAVFVLLSDGYCESDNCRDEWTFARNIKRTIYPIFIQEDFNREKYDWVVYNIGDILFYKSYKEDDLNKLFQVLRKSINAQSQSIKKINNNTNTQLLTSSSLNPTNINESKTKKILKNKIVADWTSEDIQDWCRENNLEKWCEPLANYHGRALLELNKILTTDTHLEHIANGHKLTVLDVILFKCELEKLISKTKIVDKSPTKKHVTIRRTSKSSNK